MVNEAMSIEAARACLHRVADPEMPYVSIMDLGIVRELRWQAPTLVVVVTPTYSACPAKAQIDADIVETLAQHGWTDVLVETRLSPPWSSDWITEQGRAALQSAHIAVPALTGRSDWQAVTFFHPAQAPALPCPLCGSQNTELRNEFAGSLCKSLHWCADCLNPFHSMKPI
jgi:ring-1,2-phenylacetyl-CoA epoxidase subunit PaaD